MSIRSAALALLICSVASAQAPQPGWTVTTNGYTPWCASDKTQHFAAGFAVGVVVGIGCDMAGVRKDRIWIYTLLAGLVVGFAKELHDRHHGGSPELMDALNTAAGAALPGLAFRIRW